MWTGETNIKGPKGDKGDKGDTGSPGAPGSGTPGTIIPKVEAGTGAVGVSTSFAREDHVHPLGPGGGGGAAVLVSDTPPAGAADNSLWWESDTGNLYIRYNDGNSSQWVLAVPAVSAAALNALTYTPQALTEAQKTQSRQNVYAAPFDALAYSGMQINGSMEVSQENGTAAVVIYGYTLDGWVMAKGGAQVPRAAQSTNTPAGYNNSLYIDYTTGNASPVTGDFNCVFQNIEGYRVARLAWGTASAQPLTIGFWVAATRTGTFSGSIRNNATDRSYTFAYTINAPGTWEYKTVTIPGCTDGVWLKTNGGGISVVFSQMGSTTYAAAPGVWTPGNYLSTPSQVPCCAAGDYFLLTGLVVLPGIEAPSAARSPLIMRPYDQELVTCRRYFQGVSLNTQMPVAGVNVCLNLMFPLTTPMRASPTVSHPLTDANYVAGPPGAGQWAVLVPGSAYSARTGAVTWSAWPNTSYVALQSGNATFSPAPSTFQGVGLAPIIFDARL